MTEKAKKILITTETVEVTTIHRTRTIDIRKYCFVCSRQVDWLEFEAVPELAQLPLAEVTRLISLGLLHCSRDAETRARVCSNSLRNLKH